MSIFSVDFEMTPEALEQAREAGRREEAERINAIMNHSFKRMGCTCEQCNAVALGLVYEPMWRGNFCSIEAAKQFIDNSVRGSWGHA
jgi:hypothetical protein